MLIVNQSYIVIIVTILADEFSVLKSIAHAYEHICSSLTVMFWSSSGQNFTEINNPLLDIFQAVSVSTEG